MSKKNSNALSPLESNLRESYWGDSYWGGMLERSDFGRQLGVRLSALGQERLRSIISICLATFCFALMALFIRRGCSHIPVWETAFVRGSVATLVCWWFLNAKGISVPGPHWKDLLVRGTLGSFSLYCSWVAILMMPIAEASAIYRGSALFVPFIARVLLGEAWENRRIMFSLLGFVGVLLILKPGHDLFSVGGLYALGGAISSAFVMVLLKNLSEKEHPLLIALAFFFMSSFYALVFGASQFVWPNQTETIYLVLVVIFGGLGQYFLTTAFIGVPASVVAPWVYLEIAFAAILGFLFLSQFSDLYSIGGMLIIALSAIMLAIGK